LAELVEDGPGVERRAFRRALTWSLAGHAGLLGLLVLHPSFLPTPHELPGVVMVDLVAAPPGPAPRPAPKPAPAKPAPKPAPAKPAELPKPVPPPPPPPPRPKEVVLPKEPVKPPEKPPPPKPQEKPPPRPEPAKPKSAGDLDQVLAELRHEAGETAPKPVETATAAPPAAQNSAPEASGAGGGSVRVPPEVLAWMKEARIQVRKNWVVPPALRSEPLETDVRVTLDAAGNVIGDPVITRRSGNPWYDDSVVRAIKKASPLPAPPEAGDWPFVFQPEESS
jgi:TonB family protein